MSFNFKRALRRATIMAMMDDERKKEEEKRRELKQEQLEDELWLNDLDYDELNMMDSDEREELLESYGLDANDYDFKD